ncbi:hypothetical protein [Renibacterium salmoninarum]|uniref:hypothetical protein n=1 Tax=Renibacterium salmoninarum TaxID=1646 RepID=UPI0003090B12|nr:hypothetical protein [Renibacterium salmoninarum]
MKLAASNRGLSLSRRLGAVAILGATLLGASACGYIAPQQTTHVYSPSDGIQLNIGNVEFRDILIVTSGSTDKPGRVLGAVFNTSNAPIEVTFRGADGAQTQVTVKPNEPYYLNESTEASILSAVSEPAGGLETVTVSQNGSKGPASEDAKVPVLDGTLKEYVKYIPKLLPLEPKSSESATASPSH